MKRTYWILILGIVLVSCRKEIRNVYEIDPVHVGQRGSKTHLKSDLQFVSIAYSDLFGRQISTQELNTLIAGYNSVGDKGLVIDLIVRNLLQKPGIVKETASEMQSDPEAFVKKTFERFFIRKPSEMETWFFSDLIRENSDLNPEDFYYALMSTEEYRYY